MDTPHVPICRGGLRNTHYRAFDAAPPIVASTRLACASPEWPGSRIGLASIPRAAGLRIPATTARRATSPACSTLLGPADPRTTSLGERATPDASRRYCTTVAQEFGSWVEALNAAGLPAPPGRRAEGTFSERVEEARRRPRGVLQREIAALTESASRRSRPIWRPRAVAAGNR